jgi:hypothetical protein
VLQQVQSLDEGGIGVEETVVDLIEKRRALQAQRSQVSGVVRLLWYR